ncbi:MAG: DUF4386 domain-containing protein [Gemmatimonadetes bacterium]|nr:DUF4386 domain-containing protein [Gemmatimonadota bacterium]
MTVPDPRSLRTYARTAGVLYLLIIVTAGFAEGYVRTGLVVPGDAVSTADRILASPVLFRLGFFADLIAFVADAAVAVLLYVVLRSAGETLALLAAAFRLVAHPAIAALNLLHHFGALLLLEGRGALSGLDGAVREALALHSLELHGYGYVLAGAFFGVHCALLAVLLHRSEWFPSVLGVLLGAAAIGYLFETYAVFLQPGLEGVAAGLVVVTAGTGEVALALYLCFRGVRPQRAAAAAPPASVP